MRVLIVDDSETIRRLLRRMIEKRTTFTVVGEACNGADAVDAMEQLQPDVIILDIDMPVMDGVEAARLIKGAFPAVYIVVCTSSNSNEVSDLLDEGVIVGHVFKTATNDLIGQLEQVDSTKKPTTTQSMIGPALRRENQQNPCEDGNQRSTTLTDGVPPGSTAGRPTFCFSNSRPGSDGHPSCGQVSLCCRVWLEDFSAP